MQSPLASVNLEAYFVEAAEALGLIKVESAPWLAGQALTIDGGERGAESVRRESAQEWRTTLTEKGHQEPVSAFDDSYWRAIGQARRDCQRQRDLSAWAGAGQILTVAPAPLDYCEVGAAHAGQILDVHPSLPYPGCRRRYCRCSWRMITKREAERLLAAGRAIDKRRHADSLDIVKGES